LKAFEKFPGLEKKPHEKTDRGVGQPVRRPQDASPGPGRPPLRPVESLHIGFIDQHDLHTSETSSTQTSAFGLPVFILPDRNPLHIKKASAQIPP